MSLPALFTKGVPSGPTGYMVEFKELKIYLERETICLENREFLEKTMTFFVFPKKPFILWNWELPQFLLLSQNT